MTVQLAGCIIFDEAGRILLLHRNTDTFQHWELPGGKIEKNETAKSAAIRELDEELGVKVRILSELGECDFADKTGSYHYVWFEAVILSDKPKLCEPQKFDQFKYVALIELENLELSGNMELLLPELLSRVAE